jgi:plastocyanin
MNFIRILAAVGLSLSLYPLSSLAKERPRAAAKESPADPPDIASLQEEVRRQRQALIFLLQSEQQRNAMLLQILQGNEPVPSSSARPLPAPDSSGDDAPAPAPAPSRRPVARREAATATLSGRVAFQGGKPETAFVYIENVQAPAVKGKTFEIKQQDKQFQPRVAVVQRGTRLTFPNLDAIFHNVFSVSPGNSFDLGSYQKGDAPRSVVVDKPGVVNVFCNMHSQMSASVLVVPNSLFAKVAPDGTFKIENVPFGVRRVVAWAPNGELSRQDVEISGQGADNLNLSIEIQADKGHTNKFGQPYGSYAE